MSVYINDPSKEPEQAMFDLAMTAGSAEPLIFPPGAHDMQPAFRIHMMEYSVTGGNASKSKAIYLPLPTNGLVDNYKIDFNNQEMGAIGGVASTVYNTVTGGGGVLDAFLGGAKAIAYGIGKSLAEGVGDLVGAGNTAGAAFQLGVGSVTNPNYAILFKGIEPRDFQFEWMLTAVSEEDMKMINKIVYILKKTSLPTKQNGVNFLLNYPYIAYIGLFGPEESARAMNKSIFMSFATGGTFIQGLNISFNGGAQTPAFFKNSNSPVQVKLTLNFRERNILTSDDIRSAFPINQ